MNQATETPAAVREILLEIPIEAPVADVWTALVDETNDWWHKDFFTGPNPVGFHIQPKLGGWMYEDWGDGAGLIWGTVIGVRPPSMGDAMLQTVGDSSPEWGGPNRGILTWKLTADADNPAHTVVRFSHALHGNITASTCGSLDDGWRLLFVDGLKAFCESR